MNYHIAIKVFNYNFTYCRAFPRKFSGIYKTCCQVHIPYFYSEGTKSSALKIKIRHKYRTILTGTEINLAQRSKPYLCHIHLLPIVAWCHDGALVPTMVTVLPQNRLAKLTKGTVPQRSPLGTVRHHRPCSVPLGTTRHLLAPPLLGTAQHRPVPPAFLLFMIFKPSYSSL